MKKIAENNEESSEAQRMLSLRVPSSKCAVMVCFLLYFFPIFLQLNTGWLLSVKGFWLQFENEMRFVTLIFVRNYFRRLA